MTCTPTLKRLIAGTLLSMSRSPDSDWPPATAQAQPGLAPQVYWCPNQPWNPAWGENKYWNQCWDTDNPPQYPPPFHQPNFNWGCFVAPYHPTPDGRWQL